MGVGAVRMAGCASEQSGNSPVIGRYASAGLRS
jgi:hypothetical protein